jgi:hypothetical protein
MAARYKLPEYAIPRRGARIALAARLNPEHQPMEWIMKSFDVKSAARHGAVVGLGLVALGTAACSDILGPGTGPSTTLSFRSTTAAAASASGLTSRGAADLLLMTGGGHTVDLQRADVLIDQVKLERMHTGDEQDSDANEEDSDLRNDETFRAGPVTVTLPLEGGSVSPFTQALPVGTYDELQLKARSLRLVGTYDGTAFDVTVPVNAKLETRLNPPLVIGATTDRPDITIAVNVRSWFTRSDGSVIDPRALATNGAVLAEFRSRVRASFRAFEDGDRDGTDSDNDRR